MPAWYPCSPSVTHVGPTYTCWLGDDAVLFYLLKMYCTEIMRAVELEKLRACDWDPCTCMSLSRASHIKFAQGLATPPMTMDILYYMDTRSQDGAYSIQWNCSPGAYGKKNSSFQVYFRGMQDTEYGQQCYSHGASGPPMRTCKATAVT